MLNFQSGITYRQQILVILRAYLMLQLLWLTATALAVQRNELSGPAQDAYRDIYPLFIDGCASGQRIDRAGTEGNPLGHGGIFIKGVQIDWSRNYPRLKVVPNASDNEVGVSANGQLSNQNWVAMPGHALYLYGDLGEHDQLTPSVYSQLVSRLASGPWFQSARSRKYPQDDLKKHRLQIINESIPIDVAVAWGRYTVCQRVPLDLPELHAVVHYLNDLNAYYYEGGREYEWNLLTNNCGHTAQNAFHRLGLFREAKTDQGFGGILTNLVVPSHFVVNLGSAMRAKNFPSLAELLDQPVWVQSLMVKQRLVQRPGALFYEYRPHGFHNPALNQVYEPTGSRLGFIEAPLFKEKTRELNNLLSDPSARELKANWSAYQQRLQEVLANARTTQNYFKRHKQPKGYRQVMIRSVGGFSVPAIRRAYLEYVEAELARLVLIQKEYAKVEL